MNERILVVDDDSDIRNLVSIYLMSEKYLVDESENGRDALRMISEKSYDLVILDIMMPEKDGLETLVDMRKGGYKMPVILLTAKSEQIDTIQGLTLGADDYITKPFNSMELIARVKSQLRRYLEFNDKASQKAITIDDLTVDTENHLVTVHGEEVRLTPTEYKILELLCRNKGMVFSTEKLYESIWRDKYSVADTSIMVHITKLRQKIEEDPKNPKYIKTVWGVGYKI